MGQMVDDGGRSYMRQMVDGSQDDEQIRRCVNVGVDSEMYVRKCVCM